MAPQHWCARGISDRTQTSSHACPCAPPQWGDRRRSFQPSRRRHPPHNIAPVAGTLTHRCLHRSRVEDAATALGSAQSAPAPAPPALKPSQSLRQRAARQIASWPRGCSLSSCPAISCASLAANPPHSACLCDHRVTGFTSISRVASCQLVQVGPDGSPVSVWYPFFQWPPSCVHRIVAAAAAAA